MTVRPHGDRRDSESLAPGSSSDSDPARAGVGSKSPSQVAAPAATPGPQIFKFGSARPGARTVGGSGWARARALAPLAIARSGTPSPASRTLPVSPTTVTVSEPQAEDSHSEPQRLRVGGEPDSPSDWQLVTSMEPQAARRRASEPEPDLPSDCRQWQLAAFPKRPRPPIENHDSDEY